MKDPTGGSRLMEALGRAVLGRDFDVVIRARRQASFIREGRKDLEARVDDLVALSEGDHAIDPQENRVALTAQGLLAGLQRDPAKLEGVLIMLALLVERLSALDPETQAAARAASLALATPEGTPEQPREGWDHD